MQKICDYCKPCKLARSNSISITDFNTINASQENKLLHNQEELDNLIKNSIKRNMIEKQKHCKLRIIKDYKKNYEMKHKEGENNNEKNG